MTSIIDASNAKEFFSKNNVIFLTGGAGFIGITILEKILRTLTQVKKVYLLIRTSDKFPTLQARLEEVVNNRVFDTLRSYYPTEELFRSNVISKIVPIRGDVSLDNYAIPPELMKMIQSDTSIFIHSAASVRFDDPLYIPFNTNTLGTRRGFAIAEGMTNLASFVHISSAYLWPDGYPRNIPEKLTPFLMGDHEKIFSSLTKMKSHEIDSYGKNEVLKVFPSTYTFSKALTECMIQSWYKDNKFPVVIVRPTSVCASIHEPSIGWMQGLGAFNIIVKSCALGRVQEWGGVLDNEMDYVPVDYVSKICLSAAVAANRSSSVPVVFHAGISHINPIKLSEVRKYLESYWRSVPPPRKRASNDIRCEYYPLEVFNERFEKRFGDRFRAAKQIGDMKTIKELERLHAKSLVQVIYQSNTWIFEANNTIQLDESTIDELYCGLKNNIDWDVYMNIICYGTHKYLLGEDVELPSKLSKLRGFTPKL